MLAVRVSLLCSSSSIQRPWEEFSCIEIWQLGPAGVIVWLRRKSAGIPQGGRAVIIAERRQKLPMGNNRARFAGMSEFAERLAAAVRAKKNPVVVGLDPRFEQIPEPIRARARGRRLAAREEVAAAFEEFCLRVLDV